MTSRGLKAGQCLYSRVVLLTEVILALQRDIPLLLVTDGAASDDGTVRVEVDRDIIGVDVEVVPAVVKGEAVGTALRPP